MGTSLAERDVLWLAVGIPVYGEHLEPSLPSPDESPSSRRARTWTSQCLQPALRVLLILASARSDWF